MLFKLLVFLNNIKYQCITSCTYINLNTFKLQYIVKYTFLFCFKSEREVLLLSILTMFFKTIFENNFGQKCQVFYILEI